MITLFRLRAATLFIAGTITATTYAMPFSSANQQSAAPQSDASKQPEQVKSTPPPNPDTDGIYRAGGSVTPPKITHSVEPKLPKKDRRRLKSGTVLVQIIVETAGQVRNVHVIKSSAETTPTKDDDVARVLDQSALDAVNQYRFELATLDGRSVPVLINVQVKFRIF